MIAYSHVNEDNQAEREAIYTTPYHRLICVAGSGERVIALLTAPGLEVVDVIDTNKEALFLIQLKLAALEVLDVRQYLGFIGHYPMEGFMRLKYFRMCKHRLDSAATQYWEKRSHWLEKGVLFAGQFERFLKRIRPFIKKIAGKDFEALFKNDYKRFPVKRWKLLKTLFTQKWVFWLFGNTDEAFISPNCQIQRIGEGMQKLIDSERLNHSFMAHLIFKGHLREMLPQDMPPSLQLSVLLSVQDRLRKKSLDVRYFHNDLLANFNEHAGAMNGAPLFCSLSDLLSYEKQDYVHQLVALAGSIKAKKIALIIRSFLRNDLQLQDLEMISTKGFAIMDLSKMDKTAMYKVYKIEKHER